MVERIPRVNDAIDAIEWEINGLGVLMSVYMCVIE